MSADENRLQQILFNLVGNGLKFTSAGRVEVLQKGRVVDAATARGPIRLRLARP